MLSFQDQQHLEESLTAMAEVGLRHYMSETPYSGDEAAFMAGMAMGLLSRFAPAKMSELLAKTRERLDGQASHS